MKQTFDLALNKLMLTCISSLTEVKSTSLDSTESRLSSAGILEGIRESISTFSKFYLKGNLTLKPSVQESPNGLFNPFCEEPDTKEELIKEEHQNEELALIKQILININLFLTNRTRKKKQRQEFCQNQAKQPKILKKLPREIKNQKLKEKAINRTDSTSTEFEAHQKKSTDNDKKLEKEEEKTQPEIIDQNALLSLPEKPNKLSKTFELIRLQNKSIQTEIQLGQHAKEHFILKSYNLKNLSFTTESLGCHYEKGLIGDNWTFLALKNEKSYLIGSLLTGMKLIEGGSIVYKGEVPVKGKRLHDMIYVPSLNCYFFDHNHRLYRKDIDNKAPYFYMKIRFGCLIGRSFKYSDINDRLIAVTRKFKISVINLAAKKTEINLVKNFGDYIYEFQIYGAKQDKVISLTKDGHIFLFKIDYEEIVGETKGFHHISLTRKDEEHRLSLAVSPDNKYCFVQASYSCGKSVMMVFRLKSGSLSYMTRLSSSRSGILSNTLLDCFDYFGQYLVVVCLTGSEGLASFIVYDTKAKELSYGEGEKGRIGENFPLKFKKLKNNYFYTGYLGRVIKLSINSGKK